MVLNATLAPGVTLYQRYLSSYLLPPVYPITHDGVRESSLQLAAPSSQWILVWNAQNNWSSVENSHGFYALLNSHVDWWQRNEVIIKYSFGSSSH